MLCFSFAKLTGAKCHDTRLCPLLLQAHWSKVLRYTLCFSFASSPGQSVTTHGCASFSFASLLEQQCYDTRCAFLLQAHWSKSVTICGCAPSAANRWNNMLRHMSSPSFRSPLEQRATRHVVLSLQLKASMVCDSHFTRILCRYAVLFKSSSNTAAV